MVWDFSFDGVNASTKGFSTFKVYIPDLPNIKEAIIDIPQKPGLTQIGKEFKARIIKIEGILEGSSFADLLVKIDDFKLFVFSETDKQLIFNTQTDRYYLAQKIKNEEINREATSCDRFLRFKCNDPFGYAIAADDDIEEGIVVKDTVWDITNNGQYYAYPIITITFNQVQSHIYLENNSISGNRFDISKGFVATDELEIDSKDMIIRLNDAHSPAGFGDGGTGSIDFIILKRGVNQLQIGTDDGSIDVDVNVNFRKVYL